VYTTLPHLIPPDEDEPPDPYPKYSDLVRPTPPPVALQPRLEPPDGTPVPTVNNSYSRAEREHFARTHLSARVQAMLDNPFGKDSNDRTVTAEARLRHVLLPLFWSGFLSANTASWRSLADAYSPAEVLLELVDEFGDVDFNDLRGYPVNSEQETDINVHRASMATAAFLHFEGDIAAVTRFVGGPHTAAHRDAPAILAKWKPVLREHTYTELERVFLQGCPKYINAENTEANLMAFKKYGNHSTVMDAPDKTLQSIVKDHKRGYALAFDERVFWLALHLHLFPLGMVDLDHPYKNPRPIADGSFRPQA
jgi:hypothetical protein